jgi:hypothetical protein
MLHLHKREGPAGSRRGLLDSLVCSVSDQRARYSGAPPQGFFVIVRLNIELSMRQRYRSPRLL